MMMADALPRIRRGALPGRAIFLTALLCLWSACQSTPHPGPGDSVPPGRSGALDLRSTPSGGKVFLDGNPIDLRTPAILGALRAGEHRIKVTLPGYRDWEKTVLLASGETLRLDARLQPAATGTLNISSVPFQCRIFIDGRPTPYVTPATLDSLAVGTHTVRLQKDGYEDWSHAVVIIKGRRLQLKASLVPDKTLAGDIMVQSHPSGAEIFLDGYPTGNRTPATLFNLQAGRHDLTIVREGHADWKGEVVIQEGKTRSLLVTMRKEEPRVWGSAVISTTPEGADVFLEEVRLNKVTPVVLKPVEHGRHLLRLEKRGFLTWNGELVVLPGEKAEVSVTLHPVE